MNSKSKKIEFNLELYPREAFEPAIRAYSQFCTVKVEYGRDRAFCEFESDQMSADLIALEFGNYLLETMQQGLKL
ncbi:HxsD-like protein [Novisyntrophococcus fermenticellae]|mgnify:CR=1 FL=1|uniref:HxsD-like protein n=1 Tax=Novisyntrophococcus fermenticellae TaxID=2068655 RepID=UPI001E455A62|nr:HxsD-like protein [Novisyntrophococcus fermenticellae]